MTDETITISAAEAELRTIYRRIIGQPEPPSPAEQFEGRPFAQWWTAQAEAIELLRTAEEATNTIEDVQKSVRQEGRTELSRRLSDILYETRTLGACVRRLADTMAWALLRLDIHGTIGLANRRNLVPITSIDVEEHLRIVELALTRFDEGFGLLSDLTAIIQVGDALIAGHIDGEPTSAFLEVKTGDVNAIISQALDSTEDEHEALASEGSKLTEQIRSRFGQSGVEQARRMVRQMERIKDGVALWSIGDGESTIDGETARISSSEQEGWDRYTAELQAHIEEAAEGSVDRFTIDECLFVEVAHREESSTEFESWLADEMTEEPAVTAHLVDGLYKPHTEPIFLSDLSEDAIFDVLTGRVDVVFALDLPRFAKLMRSHGVPVHYRSGRMADEARQRAPGSSTLTGYRHKGLVVEPPEPKEGVIVLGDLVANRIFFEFVRPSAMPTILGPSIEAQAKAMEG